MGTEFLPKNLFNLLDFPHREIFDGCQFVWEVIPKIEAYILELFEKEKIRANCGRNINLGEETVVEPGAYIKGPAIIGANCHIGHTAYLRENVLVGDGCVIGHGTEVKNSIFLPKATAAHLNYIGDSVVGGYVNLASGVILANFRLDQKPISVRVGEKTYETQLLKFGAAVGDRSMVGVNSILNPGTILGKNCRVYPLTSVKGYHHEGSVIK